MIRHEIKRNLHDVSHILCVLLLLSCLPSQALCLDLFDNDSPDETESVLLEVVEPYIEMHTGPGRGYPVFNVIEKGETIEVLKRKTNWYKVMSEDNKTGWAKASQLAHTLKPTGVPVDLPEVSQGDYLKSSWRVGFSAGKIERADTFAVTVGYRPISWAGADIEWGEIYDISVTSNFYGANLFVEPLPDWFITPFLTAGAGQFSFDSRHKVLVDDSGTSNYISFGAGANYYIGRDFVLRGEYRQYSVSTDDDKVGLSSWRIGLNIFF